jgi:hypothetical protein
MARIIYPDSVLVWNELFGNVKPKALALATPNPIDDFLTEEGINLVTDETNMGKAMLAHKAFSDNEKLAEELMEKHHNLFKTPFSDHKKCVQVLKKIYRSNVHKLGDWGVTVDGDNRISYPSDFLGRKQCVLDLIAKHGTFPPGTSPLETFLADNEIDLTVNHTDTLDSAQALTDWDPAHKLKEQKREERDNLLKPIEKHLRGIGAVAVAWYASAPKKAGSIGFEIDDSPQALVIRKVALNPSEEITYSKLKVGGYVTLLSEETVTIRPANNPDAEPIELKPNVPFQIIRGMGKSTFKNTSATKQVTLEAEFLP